MKVGTDGVLLGAWANIGNASRILDIGTGSGLIALMLAQRSHGSATIDAVEIDSDAFDQAYENVAGSNWSNKIKVFNSSIQEFKPSHDYHLIVCNPPYFVNSLKPLDEKRTKARHTTDLSFHDLILSTKRLLHPEGIFCVVLPSTQSTAFIQLAAKSNLFCSKKHFVKATSSKPSQRLLIEFTNNVQTLEERELILQEADGIWTKAYLVLVSPFYPWAN